MLRSDFQYELPDELIARHPAARRSDSRLLHLDGRSGALADLRFTDLPRLLRAGDLLVAPSGVPHGVRNPGPGRLLVLAVLAPAPGAPNGRPVP